VIPGQRCVQNNVSFSTCGTAFAYQQGKFLFIHKDSGEVIDTQELQYKASKISFASNSFKNFYLLLVASYSKGELDVWSIPKNSEEESEILAHLQFDIRYEKDPSAIEKTKQQYSIEGAFWVPFHGEIERFPSLFVVMEHRVSTMIYSLASRQFQMIRSPVCTKRGIAFHPTAPLVAIIHRPSNTDYLLIYSTTTWSELVRIECETKRAENLAWCGTKICIWDNYLEWGVFWYNLMGLCVNSFQPKRIELAVKTVSIFKDSLTVLGCYDDKIRILNSQTGKLLKVEQTGSLIPYGHPAIVYQENSSEETSLYDVQELPFLIPSQQFSFKTGSEFPQTGIGLVVCSHNGKYIAFRNDNMPQALWIFDVCKQIVSSILIQSENILNARWDPCSCRIALCTGTNKFFLWSPDGCCCIPCADDNFSAFDIQWNPQGKSLMILGDSTFVLAFA